VGSRGFWVLVISTLLFAFGPTPLADLTPHSINHTMKNPVTSLLLLLLAAHTARAEYAIVTGASSGIGRALALAAAAQGYDVVLCARRESALLALSDVIRTTHQRATVIVPTDLSTSAGIDTLLHTTASLDVSTIVRTAPTCF
jgi:NADPH:quinone reductase-like Zn-dependent oxidoreductase